MTQSTNTDDSGTKMEHERRFYPRLDMLPLDYITFPKKLIEQGYLEDELRTRLRNERNESSVNTYLQTRKSDVKTKSKSQRIFLTSVGKKEHAIFKKQDIIILWKMAQLR